MLQIADLFANLQNCDFTNGFIFQWIAGVCLDQISRWHK